MSFSRAHHGRSCPEPWPVLFAQGQIAPREILPRSLDSGGIYPAGSFLTSCSSYRCQKNVSFFVWIFLSFPRTQGLAYPPSSWRTAVLGEVLSLMCRSAFLQDQLPLSRKTMGRMTTSSWKWQPPHSVNKPQLGPAKVIRPSCWHTNARSSLRATLPNSDMSQRLRLSSSFPHLNLVR